MLKENYGVEVESEMVDSIGMRKIFFFTTALRNSNHGKVII